MYAASRPCGHRQNHRWPTTTAVTPPGRRTAAVTIAAATCRGPVRGERQGGGGGARGEDESRECGDGLRQGDERAAKGGVQNGGAREAMATAAATMATADAAHSGGGGEEGREGDRACRAMSVGYLDAALRRAHPHNGAPASRRFSGDAGGTLHLQQVQHAQHLSVRAVSTVITVSLVSVVSSKCSN